MPAFDYAAFFAGEGIETFLGGKNVQTGWIGVHCPFCGSEDKSNHLNCNPKTGRYKCFRNSAHWGKTPTALIREIKHCSWEEAKKISGGDDLTVGIGTVAEMEAAVEERCKPGTSVSGHRIVPFPSVFRKIENKGLTEPAYGHLVDYRLFREKDIPTLVDYYKLRYAVAGDFSKRIILPFLYKNSCIGFQARALGKARLRYLSYPVSAAKKNLLFNYGPASEGGKTLVIVEGPFGALKIDLYGKKHGYRAVGTLGASYTEVQVALIYKLSKKFDNLLVGFDPGAEQSAWKLGYQLPPGNRVINLPDGVSGPDELPPEAVLPYLNGTF